MDSGWKVRVHLTGEQEVYAGQAIGVARFAYNLALHTHEFHRANRMQWPSVNEMAKAFNACKREDYPFVTEVSKFVCEGGFADFERTLQRWRDPALQAGRPQPRRKKWGGGSFLAGAGVAVLKNDGSRRIRIPLMGSVKMSQALPDGYIPHEVRVVRENGRWYLAFKSYRKPPEVEASNATAGVDVGINPLAVVHAGGDEADAEVVNNPRALYQQERRLRRWQRAQSRRTRGGRGWHEAQRRIDKINRRIKGLRDNAQHQLSARLSKEFGTIGVESLKVKGLFRNPHLSRALGDAAISRLLYRIRYKAEWYGRTLVAAYTFYPSSKTCFDCGAVNPDLRWGDKAWACPACGIRHDRDKNSARNLWKLALPVDDGDVTLPDGKALAAGMFGGETGPDEGMQYAAAQAG